MSTRRIDSLEFEAGVTMEVVSSSRTIQEIYADQAIHPIQFCQWILDLLDVGSKLFTTGQ